MGGARAIKLAILRPVVHDNHQTPAHIAARAEATLPPSQPPNLANVLAAVKCLANGFDGRCVANNLAIALLLVEPGNEHKLW